MKQRIADMKRSEMVNIDGELFASEYKRIAAEKKLTLSQLTRIISDSRSTGYLQTCAARGVTRKDVVERLMLMGMDPEVMNVRKKEPKPVEKAEAVAENHTEDNEYLKKIIANQEEMIGNQKKLIELLERLL